MHVDFDIYNTSSIPCDIPWNGPGRNMNNSKTDLDHKSQYFEMQKDLL